MSVAEIERQLNTIKWTVSNRTNLAVPYTITGVAQSPVRENCIVLYTKLPAEVEHLHFPVRTKTLEMLGVEEPDEGWEETYPVILVNKRYGCTNMRDMNKYSFFRNFRRTASKAGIDVMNIHSARHLIGRELVSKLCRCASSTRTFGSGRLTV